ncbi:MAG: TetR/AcrR family transcriptional regulator [Lachnospiraceae bacterium]|nr:TetR/AcrR family transcriptional regulator [Lachnospiraceae bacterium]
MPRDKTESHKRVKAAIKQEFLEKGFEKASIRSIGAKAGMTSAGLYRHFANKEEMFASIVEPLIDDMNKWMERHKSRKIKMVDDEKEKEELFSESFVDMIREVIVPKKEEFIILMKCSRGTKYENFIHDFVIVNQGAFLDALNTLRELGYPVMDIDEEKIHMLISAHVTACFEPIIHNYDNEKIEEYMNLIQEFFMPGWMKIMGMN